MSVFEIVSLVLNLLFGGSFMITLATLRAQKLRYEAEARTAEATAESSELENVDKAVKIWRDLAESMEQRNKELEKNLSLEIEALRREVRKQNCTINKILKILDSINHDNLEQKVQEAKEAVS